MASGAFLLFAAVAPARVQRAAGLAVVTAFGGVLFWLAALRLGWGDVTADLARTLSQGFLLQAGMARQVGGEALQAVVRELAGQSRAVAAMLPAALALTSLAGLALAWRGFHHLAARPWGAPPAPFRAFTFNDQLIWLFVAALGLWLLPWPEAAAGPALAARNLLVVAVALYVVRGAAVFVASVGRLTAPLAVVAALGVLFLFPFVASGLAVLGLADTWLDFRRRLAPPTGES